MTPLEKRLYRETLRHYVGHHMFCPVHNDGKGRCGKTLDCRTAILVLQESAHPEDPGTIEEKPILLSCPDCWAGLLDSLGGTLREDLKVLEWRALGGAR